MRNKREPSDKWYRDILRAVQHSRCACCGEPRDDLQVAHVQLHAEGRELVDVNRPENLVLACRPCNNRYSKKTMPTPHLPPNFLEQVAGLVFLKLQPKLGVDRAAPVSGTGCTILTTNFTENTAVIDWQNSDFGLSNSTICTMRRDVNAEAVLQKFLEEATRSDCPPILPNGRDGDAAKQEMRRTINAVGETRWLVTARFWLGKEFYLMPNGNPKWDSFGEFAFNFGVFDSRRVKAERKAAEQKQREEKALAAMREQQASVEAEYQERVRVAEELRVKKERVWTYLRLCDQIIAIMRDSDESETDFFKGVLARANTVATVHEIHAAVELLHKCLKEELLAGKPFAKPRNDEFEVSDF